MAAEIITSHTDIGLCAVYVRSVEVVEESLVYYTPVMTVSHA